MTDTTPSDARLESGQIREALAGLPGWELDEETITRTYSFPDFRTALSFVRFVGELAEARDHHPDIDIRYSKVRLTLSTHSAGGLTAKDLDLARLVDQV